MLLTRVIGGHDLDKLFERQWRPEKGPPGLSPTDLWALTAAQLFRLFFKFAPTPGPAPEADAVAIVAAVNRKRAARGELPTIPYHLLTGVPRE